MQHLLSVVDLYSSRGLYKVIISLQKLSDIHPMNKFHNFPYRVVFFLETTLMVMCGKNVFPIPNGGKNGQLIGANCHTLLSHDAWLQGGD